MFHFLDRTTINSRYSGHPPDRDLVSVIAGCEKIFILNHIYRRGSNVCSFSSTPVPFPDPLSGVKSIRTLFTNRTELERIVGHIPLGLSKIVSSFLNKGYPQGNSRNLWKTDQSRGWLGTGSSSYL